MFLMNAPPVVALQSKWEAFGPPGSFRFPRCFSESEEAVARASVSARVQMVISTLQRGDAALGTHDERATQRSQRAEGCREGRLAANPALRSAPPAFAPCGLAAHRHPPAEEGAASLGPLALDSDSDDSVDRDIEEAIQEYLKAKSGAAQPMPRGAQPGGAAGGGSRGKPEPPHGGTPPALCPPKLAPVSGSVPGSPGEAGGDQGSASPVSVSSEDSFEQSIRAEIEQFLNEKRQHGNQKCDGPVDKSTDPSESPARSTLKPTQEPPVRAPPRHSLMGACKEFVFRRPPRSAKGSTAPGSLRPKVATEPENPGSTRPAAPKPQAAQSRGGGKRNCGAGKRGSRGRIVAPQHEASDSSSDDGIEEAIQLYQLEKTRKEASGDPPPGAQLSQEKGPDVPASSPGSSLRSAFPETPRRTPSRRKPAVPRATDPSPGGLDSDHLSKAPRDARAAVPPAGTATSSGPWERASGRADTSAELMCAEAILDISKTILPAPVEGGSGPTSVGPPFCSLNVPSRSDGDSSSVDSDDSIEQEIRTFLALKAQSGSLLARAESCPQPTPGPLSPPGPSSQTSVPKAPLSKPPDLPLSCRRKRRGGASAVRMSTPKKPREVKDSAQDGDRSQGQAQPGHSGQDPPSQGNASEAPDRECQARSQPVPSRPFLLSDVCVSQGLGVQGKAGEGRSVGERESSEDKSSSLDSDEDLDTAIKDLLRSKRKLKRRCRDPRAACRKKVRFSTPETRLVHTLGGLPRAWKDRGPRVLRSCLSTSRRDSRACLGRRPPGAFSGPAGGRKLGGKDAAPALQSRRRPPEGTPFSQETGARDHVCSAPSFLSEDSSVDSDDSIELEIRKFLAEKAKESVSSSAVQGGGPARPEAPCRKELAPGLQPGVCTRSQRARGGPPLAEGLRGTEKAGGPGAPSLFIPGGKGAARTEHTSHHPAAAGRCEPTLPRSASGNPSAKGCPASRRNVYVHKDQSPPRAEPAATGSAFGQLPSCATAGAETGSSGGTFHVNYGSRSLLSPSPGPQAQLALPWSDLAHHSRLPSPWSLNSEGRSSAWTGGLGGEKEKGTQGQARVPHSLTLDPRKNLSFPGFSPLLSTQLFHFGKSVPWGGQQAGLFSPHLGLPLQGPSFSAFRETQAGHSPVFGSPHLLVKDSGHWPSRKARAGLGVQDKRNLGSEEGLLGLRYGHRVVARDDQDQEVLGSDASEFSDSSLEDRGSAVKGRALKL
ncbi:protein phosphatase 1 regulatory subunit 26 [Marmota monax]|uniref:protein phosphatase 1 regulatory subunit 26 n=1 Tax=Marmota monax TaxID=9995 RepID=UPI001EB0AA49|nr:protein phosphatase 1 regulatory subunit 26 [Marmota monax]XP_046321559.1 protein phosphatase 1 regulatory subunit 26 [Marmota monax]XP_046321560.1 protein phosphatase 1 regulatory subunit 26 [Marmota monax]XP_046321561.1 protein phosphatase 1 regulatory subunit 26 [Marmota monax]XP_046321562.1 protein phosphatase 1 regulatory subunit 26 [Marmota monax]XP_046321563.1 protein phosphatase 1 regulatory subunit 26 [Marmota monax]XP_046321564.1 protein phosphatase 1 regulatory subunit 26 [Marmo